MTLPDTVSTSSPERPSGRSFLLDLLKAVGCVLIVLHHLAFYGPMSDVVAEHWPMLIDWLSDHARLAVQAFLVCSGYLTAAGFASNPNMGAQRLMQLAGKRYLRLTVPLLAALSVTVLVSEWIRPDFDHASLSATPGIGQALAHVFVLQDLLGMEALSTGVWYVAIDFQLYLLAMLALWGVSYWAQSHPQRTLDALRLQVFLVLTLLSLLRWNLNSDMDEYGLYFFGAYGLGWLAWRTRQSRIPAKGWLGLLTLGLLAWLVDSRLRVFTAWAVALLLATAPQAWLRAGQLRWQMAVGQLAKISYSVFLIHFAVSLVLNACINHAWPHSLVANALGMVLALLLSLVAGTILYRWTERETPSWRQWLLWVGVFMASVVLAMVLAEAGADPRGV